MTPLNNNFNLDPQQAQQLLKIAGQKLGTDPNQLRQQLESGRLNDLLGQMNPQQAARVNQLLQDPEALKQTLSSPAVRAMLAGLLGKK